MLLMKSPPVFISSGGVIGDVAGTQHHLNVAGNQRAAADKGAAGISIGAGKRERLIAGFLPGFAADVALSNVPPVFSSSVASSVTSPLPTRQRSGGDQRAAADGGAAGIRCFSAFGSACLRPV